MSLAPVAHLRRLSHRRGDAVATILITVAVVGSLINQAVNDSQPLILLLILAALAPLFLRETRPLAALALAVAVRSKLPDDQALLLPPLAVLYTIASRRSWPIATAAAAGVTFAALVAAAGWGHITDRGGLLGYMIGTTASCSAAVALGLYVGARRRVIDGLRERAERLERERELLTERAVVSERVRIAQELHDVVAHTVSLMVVQAQGLGATVADERVTEGTRTIADLGRQAMAEMHRTLKLLRAEESGTQQLAPQPGLASLDMLLEQSRAAGLEIELTVEGQPRQLAQSVDLSAFRIVQEALTNVIKHAAGAPSSVKLSYQAAGLRLSIRDIGEGRPSGHAHQHAGGHGLIGMQERTSLFGGTLTAGPRPDKGFEVTATLPYAGSDT